jgi:hypothetical protein
MCVLLWTRMFARFPLFREDRGLTVDWPFSYIYHYTTWVVSVTPRPLFSPGDRTPATHCTGGWMGPRAGLDTEARRAIKMLCLCRGSSHDRPVVQSVVRAVPWLRRLVAGLPPWGPGFAHGSIQVVFVVDKRHWHRFFSEFFGFPLSVSLHHPSPYSLIIRGMNNMSVSGSS